MEEYLHLPAEFIVVICTRNRPDQVQMALDALEAQSHRKFDVLVVDQSDAFDAGLERRAAHDPRLTMVRDDGRGLSRSRNVAWRATASEWLVFVDDDCLPEPDWAQRLSETFSDHPEVAYVSGEVIGHNRGPDAETLEYSVFHVERSQLVSGRWVWPSRIGFGVCHAVRRSMVERLGGWDERLGAGVAAFPASEDMDFNHRLLRAGGIAYLTPRIRSHHDQWRSREEMPVLFEGYMASWAGFAVKNLRSREWLAGVWLWLFGLHDTLRMLASSARHRSPLRLRVARGKARGLVRGTLVALRCAW